MLNTITIMGRLTKDPDYRQTLPGNIPMVTFALAVERDAKGQDGNKQTDFIYVVAWRGTADFVQKYFRKGQMAIVTGRLQVNTYEVDGQKRRSASVAANSVYFGESKRSDPQQEPAATPAAAWPAAGPGFVEVSADDDNALPL